MKRINEYILKSKNYVLSKRKVFILGLITFIIIVIPLFVLLKKTTTKKPKISEYSKQNVSEGHSVFSISSEQDYIYKSRKNGEEAVEDFIKTGGEINGKEMLPKDFYGNSKKVRVVKDNKLNPSYNTSSSSKEHYFYKETVEGIPVYGSSLIVHLKNGNEIYSVSGNITTEKNITSQKVSVEDAFKIAKEKAIFESKNAKDLKFSENTKSIINFKILGLSQDLTNYLTLAVKADSLSYIFSKRYYVDLSNGKIIYDENLVNKLLSRKIYDCKGNSDPPCPLGRSEGEDPAGNTEIDSMYSIMKQVYDYYFNDFGRDALDGNGSPLQAYVNIFSVQGRPCSLQGNAYNTGGAGGGIMAYCSGVASEDIAGHEFTHGVVSTTAGLVPGRQPGALNESIADSFANAIDNNWTIGENSRLGVQRVMNDPPAKSQPDKLFSPLYDCVSEEVHQNDGVQNKAFYLMTEGGDFNGCSINGIGSERSHAILYKALVSYLPPTANFYDMYTSILQACNDLYGSSSSICDNAKKAYQATEMDQQTQGSSLGAMCTGSSEKTATCVGSSSTNPDPTSTPTNTPVPTNTPTPTLRPGETPTSTPTPTSASANTTPTGVIFKPVGTATPTPDQYYTCAPDPKCISTGKSIQLCPLLCSPKQ